jgi:hypothetical protein
MMFYLVIPFTGVAAILFYLVDNPPTGRNTTGEWVTDVPSTSWWLLFVVRQAVTLTIANAVQAFMIDFLALDTRLLLNVIGPVMTLLLVQSKGWPFLMAFWSGFDFAMLHGSGRFAAHWLYWTAGIKLFSEENPAGHVVENTWNTTILATAMGLAVTTSIKRFVVGLYLGRRTVSK